jgi:hypothetical protein
MNRSTDSILSVYSDARTEYTKQLCVFLVPAYFQFFIDLLEKAKQSMIHEPKRTLWQFQNYLNEIHDWNMEKVTTEINKIYVNCGCDYLDDLLTAVFIAHTKVLTAIRLSSNKKKIEINVPKVEHFLFKVLCETSKLLWSSTYLFRDGISGIEKQQNYRNIEQIINEGILQAVRSLVPVKSILRDFVNTEDIPDENGGVDSDSESDDEKHENNNENKDISKNDLENTIPELNKELESQVISSNIQLNSTTIDSVVENNSQNIQNIENIQNEIITPQEQTQNVPPIIVIDDKPNVTFGQFDAVFDSNNPMESDMIFEPKDEDEDDEVPVLELLDEEGTSLSEGLDFDSLDEQNTTKEENELESIGEEDYERLE